MNADQEGAPHERARKAAWRRALLGKGATAALGLGVVALGLTEVKIPEVKGIAYSSPNYDDFLDQSGNPVAPSSGLTRVFTKNGLLYKLTPDGVVSPFGNATKPASYLVFIDPNDSNRIKAINGITGSVDQSGPDAYTVIQFCINTLANGNGGTIHLAGNSTFILSQSLIFSYGGGSHYKEVILEGEGVGTELAVTNSGQNAITISNGTNLTLRNLRISLANGAGSAIAGLSTGANSGVSIFDGRIDNIIISGGGTSGKPLVDLSNPIDSFFGHIHMFSGVAGVRAIHLYQNSPTTINYGNCLWEYIEAYVTSADALVLESNPGHGYFNLCHFLYMTLDGAGVSGNTGITLGPAVQHTRFSFVDIEGFKYGIHCQGTSSYPAAANTFDSGYVQGVNNGSCLWNDLYTYQNKFKNMFLDPSSGAGHILDNSNEGPNESLYADLKCNSNAPIISYTNHPVFRGAFNPTTRAEMSGTATIGTGSSNVTVNHFLAGTPSECFATGRHKETASLYVTISATQITISVPTPVTANRVVSWNAFL